MYIQTEQCDQHIQEARVDTMWFIFETQGAILLAFSCIALLVCVIQHENTLRRLEKKIIYGV